MNLREIDEEIEKLEKQEANYSICQKLAILYIVRDGLEPEHFEEPQYSYASAPALTLGEFGRAFEASPYEKAMDVLEEHFEAIRIIYPKEYEEVIRRLKN